MSIRLLALDLYRSQQKVDLLTVELEKASWHKKADLEDDLRKALAKRDHLRRILDGQIGRTK
jgi:hypothetical protein